MWKCYLPVTAECITCGKLKCHCKFDCIHCGEKFEDGPITECGHLVCHDCALEPHGELCEKQGETIMGVYHDTINKMGKT